MSDERISWDVSGVSPEAVLAWARDVAEGADTTSVMLTRASADGPVTMDGRATVLHHDVTAVGTFTVVLWADRPGDLRPGGDYVVRHQVADDGAGHRHLEAPAPEAPQPRPRVRAFQPDPDRDPVLVLDRWPAGIDPPTFDPRELGFSGALAFPMDVDLDDDGLDDEPAAITTALDRVLGCAKDVAALHDEGRDTSAAREHLARAVADYNAAVRGRA